jgi:hypothetical protein
MGWCGGTDIFDSVVEGLLQDHSRHEIIVALIKALELSDWDCQSDSEFYDDPCVQVAFKEVREECKEKQHRQ